MKTFNCDVNFDIKLKNAIEKMSQYVLSTYGPFGKNILLHQNGKSILTKDGVTVAQTIESSDPTENAILNILKEVADKTVKDAGDGPQPLYSKVLTPTGFVEMGSLKIGDKICGTNNSIQEVIGIYPKGKKRIYEMIFSNNRKIECCMDHLWNVTTNYGKNKIITVNTMLSSGYKQLQLDGSTKYRYYVPNTSVDFYNQDLELDPYLVGLLIGDGSLCEKSSIELSLSLYQEYVLDKIVLPSNIKYTVFKDETKHYLRVKFSRKEKTGPTMHDYVKSIGLLNRKSISKYIPKKYLYSSYSNRMALLEGLIESDGYINKRGLMEYSTISLKLKDDIIELLQGLGKQVNVKLKTKRNFAYSNTPIWTISELKGEKYGIKLKNIKETDLFTEMMCIEVSNPDKLYITDNYIVTHNTTTSILFVKHFLEKIKSTMLAFPLIPSTKIRETFDEEIRRLNRELEKNSIPIESKELLNHVAFMASNGDKLIADLVADLTDQVGATGYVSIKNSKTGRTYIDIVEGMKFKSAVASTAFLTDLQEKKNLQDCVIVVSNVTVGFSEDLLYLLRDCVENKKSILFVCPNMEEKAVLTILTNVSRGALQCCVVSPSYLGIEKLEVFEDIAITCGTVVNTTPQLNRTKASEWGYAKQVEITKGSTLLTDALAPAELLDKTIAALRSRLQDEEDDISAKRLAARIDRLTSTLGVLYVGGATEAEIIEKRHRVEDAMESCHSAMKKGVVPGGGSSLALLSDINSQNAPADATLLQRHVRETLRFICRQPSMLLYGTKDFMQVDKDLKKVISVLDLRSNDFVDPIERGLVESVWTLQAALFNAFSSAWLLTNCYGSIVEGENK